MNHKNKTIIPFILSLCTIIFAQNWETIGGNSARTCLSDAIGPVKPEILWEGSVNSIAGLPILIFNNKLVITRVIESTSEDAPIICYDVFSGEMLWSLDFGGGPHSTSTPLGFRNNIVYASNWFGDASKGDTLYALNAENGEILWKSKTLILGQYYTGIAFTENGDIVLPLPDSVARINHENGEYIWCIKRYIPVPTWCGLAIFGKTAYTWEGPFGKPLVIIAIDVETGNIKYQKEIPIAGSVGLNAPTTPVVDNKGTIYSLRPENNLVALQDNGDSLSILWNIPIEEGGYTELAIGPDGSVYFTNHKRIMRANPLTGNIIDSSIILKPTTPQYFSGHFAIDDNGTVFFNNGGNFSEGKLYSLSSALEVNWADSIYHMQYGGPSISSHGILAVAGANNILRVYRPENLDINNHFTTFKPEVTHFCSTEYITFKYYIQNHTSVKLILYNLRGQQIYSLENMPSSPGLNTLSNKEIPEKFGVGQYIYQLNIGKKSISKSITIVE